MASFSPHCCPKALEVTPVSSLPGIYCELGNKLQPVKVLANTEKISSMVLLCVWEKIVLWA